MTLSRDLMMAEAQLDAMVDAGLALGGADLVRLREFLRDCRAEATDLEATAPAPPVLLDSAPAR